MSKVEYEAYPGETPFISACVDGKLAIARGLYEQGGVDLNTRTKADTTVLEELVFKAANRPLNFKITKHKGKDVNITDKDEIRKILGSHPDDEFNTYFETAMFVLENGADPNNLNVNGQSAAFTAAGEGASWLIALLAQHGADFDIRDKWGLTALHFACRQGYADAARALLQGGASPDMQDEFGFTPVFEAVSGRHIDVLRVLAEFKADFGLGLTKAYKTNPAGTTPLRYAETHRFKEVVDFLKEQLTD